MPAPRVLLADDQADILQALRLLLGNAGFDTDAASSVGDVLQQVHGGSYDLLLMDLNYTRDTTSGREGLELIDQVRAVDRALPIVVMTGWGSIDTAVEAMRRGARSFVEKPWDDVTLVEVVRREVDDGHASRRRDETRAREDIEARLIQRALLPTAMPSIEGCDLAAQWTPAFGLGGDCYDVLRFGDARLAVSIADVVGKSLPAALLMSNLQAAVRAFATVAAAPDAVAESVNRLLCRNISPGKFVSFCYAVLDLDARTISYANAGHNPPMLLHADGGIERLTPTGAVLGVSPDWTYCTARLPCRPGDVLVCFTDGITEAMSPEPDAEEFGDARLADVLRAAGARSAAEIACAVHGAATAWTGGTLQDDATLIVAVMP